MENLPPGFRFHPTDEELITYYLSHKVADISFTSKAIVDVDLNKCEPWDLPAKASMGEKEWLENKNPFKATKEEWVVCRVFQKSAAVKKPQPSSSSQPSLGSPCDANSIVNEFGDVELPNLNINANHIANPGYSNTANHAHINAMNLNLDFGAASLPSSLSWPSSILSPNLSMNSILLKALQLRNYQPRDVTAMDYSILSSTQGSNIPPFATDLASNFQGASSSSKVVAPMPQQLQQQQQQQQEQPFNMDSMW
ncbi:hypothetical protein GQ457_04G012350 [Hibiscus cannabinus]